MLNRDYGWLEDILNAARKIQRATAGLTREEFQADEFRGLAVERLLSIIGEATKNVSAAFRAAHPEIPWRAMAGMRDILVHNYRGTSFENVWHAIAESIPALILALEPLIPQNLEEESSSDDA
ncbi:MAG TPA: DUF86 domain-containing protein [Longimicrobium sp.]|jgi:uncharacterized protein with HEPN domain